MPNLGTSNRTALRYVPEVTFGTTPATPAFKEIRYTGESLNYSIKNVVSNEIRSDRNTTDLVRVSADAGGDVQFEMSFLSFDAFIEAALCNSFSAPVSNLSSIKNGTALKAFPRLGHTCIPDVQRLSRRRYDSGLQDWSDFDWFVLLHGSWCDG